MRPGDLPNGREEAAHVPEFCRPHKCCRCQLRPWTKTVGLENLCGQCSRSCLGCGRTPPRHAEGLKDGICATCRGLCSRCRRPLREKETCRCRHWRPSPGNDPVRFVMQGFPDALLSLLHGRLPSEVPELIRDQLAHRTPQQLLARAEHRWYTRWAHVFQQVEDGHLVWQPEQIAADLFRPTMCSDPDCEDGHLQASGDPCPRCRKAEHRFDPAPIESASTSAAQTRIEEIRRTLMDSPLRTGQGRTTRRRSPRAETPTPSGPDPALREAKKRFSDSDRPERLTEPPALPEPGPEDSPILRERARLQEEERDPVRQAALQRARAERGSRPRRR